MNFKVIRDAGGNIVSFGPNDDGYSPIVPSGAAISIETSQPQPQPDQKALLQSEIDAIEHATLMNRAVREFMLAQAEQIAAASGYTPAQLYQVNLGYRKVKDIDTQIAALRAQIGAA